jgi:excisionase family DNA binding protein
LQGLVLIAMKGGKELYNLTEAGEMLDCSRQKVAKLIEGGKLYETDTGDSSRKISKQEIIRFIASQTEGPSKETYAGMLN